MKIEGYEEITEEECQELEMGEFAYFTDENNDDTYFIKKQEFPIKVNTGVEDAYVKIHSCGDIAIYYHDGDDCSVIDCRELENMQKIIKKAIEVRDRK